MFHFRFAYLIARISYVIFHIHLSFIIYVPCSVCHNTYVIFHHPYSICLAGNLYVQFCLRKLIYCMLFYVICHMQISHHSHTTHLKSSYVSVFQCLVIFQISDVECQMFIGHWSFSYIICHTSDAIYDFIMFQF